MVLIPTVNDIVQELKSNRKNDFIVEFILAIGVVGNLMINIYLGMIRCQYLGNIGGNYLKKITETILFASTI